MTGILLSDTRTALKIIITMIMIITIIIIIIIIIITIIKHRPECLNLSRVSHKTDGKSI